MKRFKPIEWWTTAGAATPPNVASDISNRCIHLLGTPVLLPEFCKSDTVTYDFEMLSAVLKATNQSVFIYGETGTGKEIFVQYAQKLHPNKKAPFVELNCAGLSETLIHSNLFGHVEGAYTGAKSDRGGLILQAENGVLFLDEIHWLPKHLQAVFLRFMMNGEFYPLGSDTSKSVRNVRILAATNHKKFKKMILPDLLYRFDHIIELPPLRERGSDIIDLLPFNAFLGTSCFTDISLRTLLGYLSAQWDGNIRELEKYCNKKAVFRQAEVLAPNEDEWVLDDAEMADRANFSDLHSLAGFILGAFEQKASTRSTLCTKGITSDLFSSVVGQSRRNKTMDCDSVPVSKSVPHTKQMGGQL